MSFLIDTDICSAQLKGVGAVCNRFLQYGGRLNISTITLTELSSWVYRSKAPRSRQEGMAAMMADLTILPVDEAVAQSAGKIRAAMLDAGKPIATTDLLIASTALHHDLTLVTHNTRHYAHVPGLHVVDWLDI